MAIGIVIATYQRKDGTTQKYLERALNSVKNQTYDDYKVFLIGDKYENKEEFEILAKAIIPAEKIYSINLSYAKERDKYLLGDAKLWCAGGVNATNFGIEQCLKEGIHYICHLDHDDWWEPIHLEEIQKLTNQNHLIICTKAVHINNQILPVVESTPFFPKSGDLVHSATCINFAKTDLRYRDVFEIEGKPYPSDADLWNRLSKHMVNTNSTGALIKKITCNHITERQ